MRNSSNGVFIPAGVSTGPNGAGESQAAQGGAWWSKQFKLSVLECFSPITKGLPYFRDGQVTSLEIDDGVVFAKVQGSRSSPYMVEIRLKVLDEGRWDELEAALAVRLGPAGPDPGLLLAQDLAPHLAEAGQALLPSGIQELTVHCNCSEMPKPCRHVAATYYRLGEAFDQDPFLLCRWRGREREELLERVGALREALAPPEQAWRQEPGPAPGSQAEPWRGPALADPTDFYLQVLDHCQADVERINLVILAEWGRLNEEALRVQALIQDLEGRKLVAGQIYSAASDLLGLENDLDVSPAIQEG